MAATRTLHEFDIDDDLTMDSNSIDTNYCHSLHVLTRVRVWWEPHYVTNESISMKWKPIRYRCVDSCGGGGGGRCNYNRNTLFLVAYCNVSKRKIGIRISRDWRLHDLTNETYYFSPSKAQHPSIARLISLLVLAVTIPSRISSKLLIEKKRDMVQTFQVTMLNASLLYVAISIEVFICWTADTHFSAYFNSQWWQIHVLT